MRGRSCASWRDGRVERSYALIAQHARKRNQRQAQQRSGVGAFEFGAHIPAGVNGDRARNALLNTFNIEIGTSFGKLHGKIWRIGAMGYNARPDCVLQTLAALQIVLVSEGHRFTRGTGVDAAYQVCRS